MKWSSIWSINKIFILITVLETNIQKERPLCGDLPSVSQVFNMTTIISGSFLNDTSLFWAYSANAILWCLFWTVSLGNTFIWYGYKFKSLFNIHCTDHLDIPSCAAAFLVELLGLLCSATLTVSVSPENAQTKADKISSPTLNHHY
jgi:hypothetical protein